MAIIAMPAAANFARSIDWTLDRPAQVNRQVYSGRRQVVANPWHGKWSAKVELVPIRGEAKVLAWRAFLAKLKGQVNTFRLPAVEADQHALSGEGLVYGTYSAGVTTLRTLGWPTSPVVVLKAGQMFTLNDQLVMLTQDATADPEPAARWLTFEPPLRAAAAHNTALVSKRPTALVALTDSSISWRADVGSIYGIGSLDVEEAF